MGQINQTSYHGNQDDHSQNNSKLSTCVIYS